MYEKVATNLNFLEREKEISKYWEENNVFEKSIKQKENCPTFTFFDGPPTANGKPHIGHIITRVYKDIIPRYRTMKGYKVLRKAGWDTHGLPVELGIEKELGISGKPDIEKYGIEPFIDRCKESVWKYEKLWEEMSNKVGYWVDMKDPYVTYYNDYIESEWWALKTIWEKDLIYKGHKIVPYCPRCGTALSSHEVAQGYKDVTDSSIYVKFEVKGQKNTYLLAWTTTPWTLPSNVALTVNADYTYAKVESNNEYYILAKDLIPTIFENEYKIIEEYLGKEIEGLEYVPLYNYAKVDKKAYYVVCADFVTLTDGTGIVHTAPAFGEDDAMVGRKYDLPFVQMVNDQGKFIEEVTPWAGIFVKDGDKLVIKDLEERNLCFKILPYEHSYPFCWRCDTPLLYYARSTWFIKMTEVRDKLIKNNNKINWIPESIGKGRFGDWIENVIDWGISRERYWGTPLPIWECDCGHKHMVGSIKELKEMGENVPENIELHKPYIDNVVLKCPECNGKMKRVSEVIDCWFDSGSMPFAQWHYPFENEKLFKENFPADFISEAVDQTRGWFYTLLAISTLLFDEPPFKNVIVLGHVNDKNGQKMSKSKGNVIDPNDILDKQGADAVRWYFYSGSAPWLPTRFYEEAVNEAQRKFMGTLWNTYAFYVLYANIDKFDPTKYEFDYNKLNSMDKWVISKLNSLVEYVDKNLEEYKVAECARELEKFVDDLSNWYIRRSRERFWQKDMNQDKINAFSTLYNVLVTLSKLIAPFVPFMAESIYKNLVLSVDKNASESVHFCDYPVYKNEYIDKALEENMDTVLDIVVLGRACRNGANIKNRQPLAKMYVVSKHSLEKDYLDIIRDELNVKNVEFTNDVKSFITYKLKPQLKTVGPKYGKLVGKIGEYLTTVDGNEVVGNFNLGKTLKAKIDGNEVELTKDDVLIEEMQKEKYVSESDRGITVVLDTNLNEQLIEEGYVREVISKIQTMRKEADFDVCDSINVYYNGSELINSVITKNKDFIGEQVLGVNFHNTNGGFNKEWNINGENLILGVEKI